MRANWIFLAAQSDIANDWIAAYKKYFHADMPLALRFGVEFVLET